jgi:hypothetical protein
MQVRDCTVTFEDSSKKGGIPTVDIVGRYSLEQIGLQAALNVFHNNFLFANIEQ